MNTEETKVTKLAEKEGEKRKVLIVLDPLMGHVTQQARGLALRETLEQHGWRVEYVDIRQVGEDKVADMAKNFDVVYLLKVPFLSLVKKLKQMGRKTVFDLADALWKEHHRAAGWQDLDGILAEVDAITSDNPYVAEYGRKFNKPITIVPMATQIEKFDALRGKIAPRKDKKIRLGWVGSQGTVGAIIMLQGTLQKLVDRYPNLELRILGADASTLPSIPNLQINATASYTEDDMIREVLQMDIGIHPISIDLEDYIIRGGMKAFVYMSAGLPAVCHDAGECADVIQDGVTGMLANSEQEWLEKLDLLIRSPKLRRKIGQQGIETIRQKHSLEYVTCQLEAAFLEVTDKGSLPQVVKSTGLHQKPKILAIADVPNWIFDRHCKTLQRHLSDDFDITIAYVGQSYDETNYDLIYPLEWNLIPPQQIRTPDKYVTGIRSHLWWPEMDFSKFNHFLASSFQQVHVVSKRLYDIFSPALPNVVYVTHGVDTQFFTPTTRTDLSGQKIRMGWAGNRKSGENKGFSDVLDPLSKLPGVEFVYCGYSDRLLTIEEMHNFYDSLDVYICASEKEGNNNPLLEAASMERAIITTDNGTVPEYLKNGESALIVERRLPDFIKAVEMLRDNPQERLRLGKNARQTVLNGWDIKQKVEDFRAFFWSALKDPTVSSLLSSTHLTADNFDEDLYLMINADVAEAVKNGQFRSGWEHYTQYGQKEGRRGVSLRPPTMTGHPTQFMQVSTTQQEHPKPAVPKHPMATEESIGFCIISNGQRQAQLDLVLQSIHFQQIPNYEVIIAGVTEQRSGIEIVSLPQAAQNGKITVLRNAAAEHSHSKYLVFMDDDIVLLPGWYQGIQTSLKRYDILAMRLHDLDGGRHCDWTFNENNLSIMLNYDEWCPLIYVTGGFNAMQAHVWRALHWNEKLGMNQSEDVDFARRAMQAGYTFGVSTSSIGLHLDNRYTQVGRNCLRRSPEGVKLYLSGELAQMLPEELVQRATLELRQGRIAESADCLQFCLQKAPDYLPAMQIWGQLLLDNKGMIEGGFWQPRPLLDSHVWETNLAPEDQLHHLKDVVEIINHQGRLISRVNPHPTLPSTTSPVGKAPAVLAANQSLSSISAQKLLFNKVCNFEDFSNPELVDIIRDVFRHEITRFSPAFPKNVEYRKYWEIAMSVRALRSFGALHRKATILGVGAGTEVTMFYLTQHAGQVVATDLYNDPGMWGKYAPGFMFTEPQKIAPYPFEQQRLVVKHMDGRLLEFSDHTFNGIFSSGSIEHFGDLLDIAHAAYEMGRVLKPNGVLTLSTEYCIRGPQGGIGLPGLVLFTPELLQRYIIEASGLELVDAPDFAISERTLASKRSLQECVAEADAQTDKHGKYPRVGEVIWSKYPHLVLEHQGYVFGSVHLTLRKTENYPICVNNWALPARGTATITELPPLPTDLTRRADSIEPTTKRYPITIAIDARTFSRSDTTARGIGQYAYHHLLSLIPMCPQWGFIFYGETIQPPKGIERLLSFPNVTWKPYDTYHPEDIDLAHFLDPMNMELGYDSPMRLYKDLPRKTITFYDLTPLHLYWEIWPEAMRQAYRQRLDQIEQSSAVVMTISEHTRQDLLQNTHIPAQRVEVVMAGLNRSEIDQAHKDKLSRDSQTVLQKLGVTKPFFLYVGAFDPHKNIHKIILAFLKCYETHPCQLVFVGRINHEVQQYMDYFSERKFKDVIFTDFISREDLEVLYQEAVALVFLSKYEGFGLPVLEAMAHGCAVIASNTTSIPEVAGDAALLFDPDDEQAVAMAMVDLIGHPEKRIRLRDEGLAQAKKFEWETVARKTVTIWEEMLGQPFEQTIQTAKTPPTSTRIGIDVRTLFNEDSLSRGIGHYSLYHLSHIISQRPQWRFILYGESRNLTEAGQRLMAYPNVELRPYETYTPDDVDLVHILDPMTIFPGFDSGMRLFQRQPLKTITFFDLIPLRLYEKSWNDATRQSYHQHLQQTVADKNIILTISEYTRQDLINATQISPERVTTIMAGLNRRETTSPKITDQKRKQILKKHKITKPFFIYVGSFNPHKNIPQVIDAFMRCHETHSCQMVFVGAITHEFKPYMDYIAEKNIEDILFTGYIPRQELEILYQEAISLVFLSRYEGFGFPVLEAMANGCPVISSNVSSIPEVTGNAALMFSLDNVQGIVSAMIDLFEHPEKRQQFKESGLKQASKFRWEDVAAKTIAIWEEMLASNTISEGTGVMIPVQKSEPEKSRHISMKIGFNVIGYVSGNLGIGVTARNVLRLLLDKGFPVSVLDLDPGLGRGKYDLTYNQYAANSLEQLSNPVNLFILPPADLTALLRQNPALWQRPGYLNIAWSMWELPVLPPEWIEIMQQLDVLVAESEFIRYTYSFNLSNVLTLSSPHPLYLPSNVQPDRTRFGLPEDAVLFLTSFEPHSDIQRKNPFAVVEAFERGLGADSRARLVIKLNNPLVAGKAHPLVDALHKRCDNIPNIRIIAETYSYPDVLKLYASCDVFVSLHRAEGLGLGLMEAMMLAKPVIATAWSGNMSFMDHSNSCLVSYKLIPVQGTIAAYDSSRLGSQAVWADPNIDEAAVWMRRLVEEPELRHHIGHKADNDMRRYQDEAQRGHFIEEIESIWAQRTYSPTPKASDNKAIVIKQATMDTVQVDIIIPVYGQPQLLQQCVESVLATTSDAHLILVDDNSPGDDINALFAVWHDQPRLTLANTITNLGFLGTCKAGVELGKARYLLFLNSDTQALEPGWLEKLLPSEDNIAITGAKLLYPPSTPGPMAGRIQHAGVARDENGVPYHPFLGWKADIPQANLLRDVNAITGACFLVRRQVWDELGGWDPRFGRGVYEDVDLCWQARQKGYRVVYQPEACLYHYSGASEAIGGRHLLYGKNKTNNLEKLLTKWQGIKSDEDIFFGKESMHRWQRARNQINQAATLLNQRQFNQAMSLVQKAVKIAPDLPEVLVGYAQLLASQGKHHQAAEQLVKAIEFAPDHWDARLRLVDEWLAAGVPEKASAELALLQAILPDDSALEERAAILRGRPKMVPAKTTPSVQVSNKPAVADKSVSAAMPASPATHSTAAETLRMLLEADDLPAALQTHKDRLDNSLLNLVRENARTARSDGESELAEGMDNLATYIAEVLTNHQSPAMTKAEFVPAQTPVFDPTTTLQMLLEADDLPAALQTHKDRLDSSLLNLVRENAKTARADGNTDLAEGLNNLADIIAENIEQRRVTSP